jgi:hypothetical protein
MRAGLLFLAWSALVVGLSLAGTLWYPGGALGWDPFGFVLLILACVAWPLPIAIAAARRHPDLGRIAILDAVLGWTGIGWIAALVWSLRPPREAQPASEPRASRSDAMHSP